MRGGHLILGMQATRDTEGFARLRELCDRDPHVSAGARAHVLHRGAVIIGAKGGLLRQITVGDVMELLDAEASAHAKPMAHGSGFYRMLHRMGIFEAAAPQMLRELTASRQRTPGELIDRYDLACRPVRDLLVDYLKERQPALDYSSLRKLSAALAGGFWKDLERHHPGISSLHLPAQVSEAWKQRLRSRQKTIVTGTGAKAAVTVERISYRQCLTPVRAGGGAGAVRPGGVPALAPASKLAASEWMSAGVHIDGLGEVSDDACYRAMDWLHAVRGELEKQAYFQVADLLNLEVDLLFFDTTSTYFELEDPDGEVLRDWRGEPAAREEAADPDKEGGFRTHGKSKDSRDDLPQIVVALAVTREAIPVRSGAGPGTPPTRH